MLLLAGAASVATDIAGAATASALAGPIASATRGQERVRSYAVELVLASDSTMHVRETIEYDIGSATDRHGILRTMPREYPYNDRFHRVTPVEDVEASSPSGAPDDLQVEQGSTTVIRIGDPDETVEGRQTYVLSYTVRGVVNAFSDHEELYWNAVGQEWDVPIDAVRTTLEAPATVEDAQCFKGAQGSTQRCTVAGVGSGETAFTASGLQPGQGMTVVASFAPGTFTGTEPILEEIWSPARAFALTPWTLAGSVGLLTVLAGGLVALVARRGRDEQSVGVTPGLEQGLRPIAGGVWAPGADPSAGTPTRRTPWLRREPVAVRLTPPDGLRAGQIGTLLDERANVVDVTATIIDLAVRGLLRVEEVEGQGRVGTGDWLLRRLRDPRYGELYAYEGRLFTALFPGRDEVLLSELKQTFRADLVAVQSLLYEDVTQRGWFRGNPSRVRITWTVLGVVLLVLGIALTVVLAITTHLGLLGIGVTLAGLLFVLLAGRMPARTAKGTAVLAQARGFRRYLETVEADQIHLEEGVDVFSRNLPFAIVFGVAERWASAFARLAARGAPVVAPLWYVPYGYVGAFGFDGFGRSMDSFATTAAGALAAATPSSSGSSGLGGRGFSGGGMGGGGGGSW
jgi:uncharacterized protein (TIGR04222 family)